METTDEQQEARKVAQEKEKTRREKLAGYFYDLSKLCFTGIVVSLLVPLLKGEANSGLWFTTLLGICLTALPAILANRILK